MNTFSKTADRQGHAAGNVVPGRGKTRVCALFAVCLLGSGSAFAGDPCKSVLCLYGKFTGNSGGSECRSAEQDYFSILVKKHGNIKWSQTATARQDYLNSCPGADQSYTQKSTTSSARSGAKPQILTRRTPCEYSLRKSPPWARSLPRRWAPSYARTAISRRQQRYRHLVRGPPA
nr:hypothetical protein pPsy0479a_00009 [Pseudomonas syringae]